MVALLVTMGLVVGFSCTGQDEAVQETAEPETGETPAVVDISQEELRGDIPELEELHSAVHPLWHTAYPQKDYDMIKDLLPQLDSLTANLDEATLPKILHMKQEAWDEGKEELKAGLQRLHEAVDSDDKTEILKQVEAFHSHYEQLARLRNPVLPELEAFHRELYKIMHYYLPNGEADNIRETVTVMQEKIQPVMQAELPERLADKSEDFSSAVQELESKLTSLAALSGQDDAAAIEEALKELHTAFVNANELIH
jgi:DNA repair exonuclease SbcCD ATPase subunit